MSFWPQNAAGKKDLKIKRSHPGAFVNALQEDIRNEGNRQPITITITNYDAVRLAEFIVTLQQSMPRYQLARYNCSHVVAECLKVACEKKPSFYPSGRPYGGMLGRVIGLGIWTPREILKYAEELAT
ncbi:hypothetical protein [Steroidobacter sp.]|uniref:hypothetical protein n=1 Tax=Steroidobacter sp. TaxID=1978227 RepID=UPI002ED90738